MHDETSRHLVKLTQNGKEGLNCLSGKRAFVDTVGGSSRVATGDDVVSLLRRCYLEQEWTPL